MLDTIRGGAILAVLVFHLRIATGVPALDRALRPIVDVGWVGVDLFFVLSGLLVGTMILAEADSPAGFSRSRFFARRALRLWPVLYLYLAAMMIAGGGAAWAMVSPVLLHVQNYATHGPSHLWSLAVEEHFYLVAALGLPWLLRRGAGRVAIVLVAVLIGCLVLRIAALAGGAPPTAVQWQTPYRIDAIAAGVLLAWGERYRPGHVARVLRHRRWCIAGAAAGFALLAYVDDVQWRYGAGLTIAWGASALLILGLRHRPRTSPFAGPVAALGWLGGISYSLYIWHASLAQVADALATAMGIDDPPVATAWRYAVATGGAAAISACIERPFMASRYRLANRSAPSDHGSAQHIAIANSYHR
ncbi:acyltransferase [Sphingomonas sp. A2-49]|uniref:acyltransferase family protein n=1 Tax=Sphingomonas sp. A2-49 TaxID=1391375 RepID=UPI0021CF4BBC|nr:acyltransferase [Sphingomonas sp. A2-49]MCU6452751.1 acyltransferase [Sphingomonas sp. A2-49]